MGIEVDRAAQRARRHRRVRKKIFGTPERPRLCVYKSLRHLYAQLIDDTNGTTVTAASTLAPELRGKLKSTTNIEAAEAVGRLIAQKALDKNIDTVVFDRSGYKYHGRVKALADAARAAGLRF